MEIAHTIAEAFLAAKLGDEVEAVEAVAKSLPPAVQAAASLSAANVTKADGPADSAPAGVLATLRNATITRQRFGLDRRAESAPERRNVTLRPSGVQGPNPAWMLTSAPGYSAGVYQR